MSYVKFLKEQAFSSSLLININLLPFIPKVGSFIDTMDEKRLSREAYRKAQHVLVLRPDNIGDVVVFLGALKHIRQLFANSELSLCVKRHVFNLVDLCPHVDRLVAWEDLCVPRIMLLPLVRGHLRLRAYLRPILNKKYRTDVLLAPVRSPHGGLFGLHAVVSSISAKQKYGIAGDYSNQSKEEDHKAEILYTARLRLAANRRSDHELVVTKEFLQFIGLEISSVNEIVPEFWTDETDRAFASTHCPPRNGTFRLGVFPGSAETYKLWPVYGYSQAISPVREFSFDALVFGGTTDRAMCAEVARALRLCPNVSRVQDLSGGTTLRQLVECLKSCDLVLATDSVASHIAVALGRPTVVVMGGGQYGRFFPWGDYRIHRVAHLPMDCYYCNWRCIYPITRCIEEIPPSLVTEELRAAIKNSKRNGSWSY